MISKSAEIIVIIFAILSGIAIFILMLFYCTRHQKRIQDDSLRHGHDSHTAQQSGQRYFGAVGWFQRYRRQLKAVTYELPRVECYGGYCARKEENVILHAISSEQSNIV